MGSHGYGGWQVPRPVVRSWRPWGNRWCRSKGQQACDLERASVSVRVQRQGNADVSTGAVRQEASCSACGPVGLTMLFRPATDWTRPTHIRATCVTQSMDLNVNHSKTFSQKHPESRLTNAWALRSPVKLPHKISHCTFWQRPTLTEQLLCAWLWSTVPGTPSGPSTALPGGYRCHPHL